jgi:hypothetical protein
MKHVSDAGASYRQDKEEQEISNGGKRSFAAAFVFISAA